MADIRSILDTIVDMPHQTFSVKSENLPDMSRTQLTSPMKASYTVKSATSTAETEDDERPSHSYMNLIVMALLSMPGRQGTLHEIYRFISGKFRYYTKNRKHWKNSVRHNLALHRCFERLDSEADYTLGHPAGKKSKVSPLWSLIWNPQDDPNSRLTRKRKLNIRDDVKKTPTSKKTKPTDDDSSLSELSNPGDAMTTIARMLPSLGPGDAALTSPSSLHQGLIQPPLTPESDYGSLSSDHHSPFIPTQTLSTGSTMFEYPSHSPSPSPPLVRDPPQMFDQLPLLSVEDICSVLQCDDCPPDSPDSGTGPDLLDGFEFFDETPAQPEPSQYLHHPEPCLADSLLSSSPDEMSDSFHQPHDKQPAFSFLVPKVPVDQPLSLNPW